MRTGKVILPREPQENNEAAQKTYVDTHGVTEMDGVLFWEKTMLTLSYQVN